MNTQAEASRAVISEPAHFDHIDLIRCIAILMVIAVHIGQPFAGTRDLTWLGQFGVQVFFVASAYTLCLSWTARSDEKSKTLGFFIRRFFRIAPLYYAGLVFYSIRLMVMVHVWAQHPHARPGEPPFVLEAAHYWAILGANVLFIHGFVPVANNTNVLPGGWSIGAEMAFYVLFPLLVGFFLSWRRWFYLAAVLYTIAFVIVYAMVMEGQKLSSFWGHNLLTNLPVFFCGFLVYDLAKKAAANPSLPYRIILWLAVAASAGAMYFLSQVNAHQIDPVHTRVIAPYSGLLCRWMTGVFSVALILAARTIRRIPSLLQRIGTYSYAMYLGHFSILLIARLPLHIFWIRMHPIIGLLTVFLISVTLSFFIAWGLHVCIERPGIAAGKRVVARLQRQDSPAPGLEAAAGA